MATDRKGNGRENEIKREKERERERERESPWQQPVKLRVDRNVFQMRPRPTIDDDIDAIDDGISGRRQQKKNKKQNKNGSRLFLFLFRLIDLRHFLTGSCSFFFVNFLLFFLIWATPTETTSMRRCLFYFFLSSSFFFYWFIYFIWVDQWPGSSL